MLRVKAKPGIKAPFLHKPKTYIPDDRIVEVENCHYYKSMVVDGDLLLATDDEWAAQQEADVRAEVIADKKARADASKAAKATPSTN